MRQATKLSYREQRELERLPQQIRELEREQANLERSVSAPDFYSRPHDAVQAHLQQLTEKQSLLDRAIERWTELEDKQLELRRRP